MNELNINCNLQSPQKSNSKIIISVENQIAEKLLYKYMIGCNGLWEVLKDFSDSQNIEWTPKEDGKYIIMVQAKKIGEKKSFNYISRMNYVIGDAQESFINNIFLNKGSFTLGDKMKIFVDSGKISLMYRYWIRVKSKWQLVRDYSTDNTLTYTIKSEDSGEILVECKEVDSKSDFDDFKKARFVVKRLSKVEIVDFKCLSNKLICGFEINFQVQSKHEDNRTILYKFFRINSSGEVKCLQNYSTKRTVSYVEEKEGSYKLLCLAKDMYSENKFDDRAILNLQVKRYEDIFIKNLTTDLNSPQLSETDITIKAEVVGGKEILYRYVIEGIESEDSGYIKTSSYKWKSSKPGNYKIMLFVRDVSYKGEYEACDYMNFIIDERSSEAVNLKSFTLDKNNKILRNEVVRAVVSASGGTDLLYGFDIKKDGKLVQNIKYRKSNWIKFIPKEAGEYELEAKVKDNYSRREYDCHLVKNIEVLEYIPASIDYILYPSREYYMVGDRVSICIITQNTKSILVNYVMNINNHRVEETGFIEKKNYFFTPKFGGKYEINVFARSIYSKNEFDCKKSIVVNIIDTLPVTNVKIFCEKNKFVLNTPVTFYASSEGGKDVLYEFYVMEKGEWMLSQNYSRKSNYTFIPFSRDKYRIMVLCKSQYSMKSYEDYYIFTFKVS